MIGYPLSFFQEGIHSNNKQTLLQERLNFTHCALSFGMMIMMSGITKVFNKSAKRNFHQRESHDDDKIATIYYDILEQEGEILTRSLIPIALLCRGDKLLETHFCAQFMGKDCPARDICISARKIHPLFTPKYLFPLQKQDIVHTFFGFN